MKKFTKLFFVTALAFVLIGTNVLPSISLNAEDKIQVSYNQTASASYAKAPSKYDGEFTATQEYTIPAAVARAINAATAAGGAALLQSPLEKIFPKLPAKAVTVIAAGLAATVAGADAQYYKITSKTKFVWNSFPTKCTYYTTSYIYKKASKSSTTWTLVDTVHSIKTYEIDTNTD